MFDFVTEHNTLAKPAFEAFLRKRGVEFWPSSANYIFCYFEAPRDLEVTLRGRGILVRPKTDAEGVVGLRVSIGTLKQTQRLIENLEDILDSRQKSPPLTDAPSSENTTEAK